MNPIQIECKKNGLQQNQDGTWKLSLTVHSNDMSQDIAMAPMGTRYQAVLVEIGDDEQPVVKQSVVKQPARDWNTLPLSQQAGIRCEDVEFQDWLFLGDDLLPSEVHHKTLDFVRDHCRVKSRRELDTSDTAAARWHDLDRQYRVFRGWEAEARG